MTSRFAGFSGGIAGTDCAFFAPSNAQAAFSDFFRLILSADLSAPEIKASERDRSKCHFAS